MNQQQFRVLGLMSGTSLDGLDIVCADFTLEEGEWDFNIIASTTISYAKKWLFKLKKCTFKQN